MILTGREHYQWLVPVGTRAAAHAFVPGSKHSVCLKAERFATGHMGWERERIMNGEPKRLRCGPCSRILRRNPDMVEVTE